MFKPGFKNFEKNLQIHRLWVQSFWCHRMSVSFILTCKVSSQQFVERSSDKNPKGQSLSG